MGATAHRSEGVAPTGAEVEADMRARGLSPSSWGNGPGDRYGWHEHDYRKELWCVVGSIVFHTHDGDLALEAGDRLDIDPATPHAATVGSDGCRCVEAAVERRSASS